MVITLISHARVFDFVYRPLSLEGVYYLYRWVSVGKGYEVLIYLNDYPFSTAYFEGGLEPNILI